MPFSQLVANLHGRWKALALLFGIFSVGMSVGAFAGGFTRLPARVSALEDQHAAIHQQMLALGEDVAAIRRTNRQMLCLTVAERQHTDWHLCIEP